MFGWQSCRFSKSNFVGKIIKLFRNGISIRLNELRDKTEAIFVLRIPPASKDEMFIQSSEPIFFTRRFKDAPEIEDFLQVEVSLRGQNANFGTENNRDCVVLLIGE